MREASGSVTRRRPPGGIAREQGLGLRTLYFIAAAVLAALIPLILSGGLWIRAELQQGQRDFEEFLEARAVALSQQLDSELRQELAVLQAIAALPSLDQPNLSDFHGEASRMLAAMPQWAAISLADSERRQVVNTSRPVGDALPAMPEPLIRRVFETRMPAVHTPIGSAEERLTHTDIVLLSAPVIRDNSVRWAVVAAMKRDSLQQLVTQQSQDPRVLAVVIDERDRILARSRDPQAFVGQEIHSELKSLAATQTSGLFTAVALDREEVVTSFRRSPVTGWLSVVATDRQQFEGMSARSTWATLAAGALSLTLASVLAVFLFYNVIERRVSEERLAASRALGELDARLLATTQEALAEQRKAASEREVLLREIYHRVKNNLQIIQSLLRLGSRELSQEQREPFESAVRRIGAMARVHTLLYKSPHLASIDFKDYLEGLVAEISEAFGAEERGITTTLDAQPMQVPLDTAVPLAFIAVELLTNAYKHAFPGGRKGTITVAASAGDGHGVFSISDTGIGLPPDAVSKRPLGLTIVSKLVQQIGGTLEQPSPGSSTFRIVFPFEDARGDGATAKAGSMTQA
jgi:two-component sensor histidine kinase